MSFIINRFILITDQDNLVRDFNYRVMKNYSMLHICDNNIRVIKYDNNKIKKSVIGDVECVVHNSVILQCTIAEQLVLTI